jgi:hypothetical protein
VQEAFVSAPPVDNVYAPIKEIMKRVKSGESEYYDKTKSVRKVLQMIYGVINLKLVTMEKQPGER